MLRKLPALIAALVFTATTAVGGTLATAGTAAAAGRAGPGPGVEAPAGADLREQADRIMGLTYAQFARTPHIEPFNWTNDGCSVPGGFAPYSEVFRPACVQHDFGYRNYGGNHELKLSVTRATKNWIDGRFRTEMKRICDDTYRTPLRHRGCVAAKDAYYLAVQGGGDAAFF